jgi:hypothetical protein
MKTLLLTLLVLLVATFAFTQQPSAAIELIESNILYRGFENKVKIAVNETDGQTISLVGNNCTVKALKAPNEFIVKPGNDKITTLSVVLTNSEGEETIVSTTEYRIKLLPDPDIYWGKIKSGNEATLSDDKLEIGYVYDCPLQSNFIVLKWKMYSDLGDVSGNGPNVTAIRSVLENISEPTVISFTVHVLSPDGITRLMSATRTVNPSEE